MFYSTAHPQWQPLPGNVLDLPTYWLSNSVFGNVSNAVYALDDQNVNYDELGSDNDSGRGGGGGFSMLDSFGSTDFWIELTGITNDFTLLTLHGTTNDGTLYQVITTTNLAHPRWNLQWQGVGDDGQTILPPQARHGQQSL